MFVNTNLQRTHSDLAALMFVKVNINGDMTISLQRKRDDSLISKFNLFFFIILSFYFQVNLICSGFEIILKKNMQNYKRLENRLNF